MLIFESKTYQCADCFSIFEGIVNIERTEIKYTHPGIILTGEMCQWNNTFFIEPLQTKQVIALKDNNIHA